MSFIEQGREFFQENKEEIAAAVFLGTVAFLGVEGMYCALNSSHIDSQIEQTTDKEKLAQLHDDKETAGTFGMFGIAGAALLVLPAIGNASAVRQKRKSALSTKEWREQKDDWAYYS